MSQLSQPTKIADTSLLKLVGSMTPQPSPILMRLLEEIAREKKKQEEIKKRSQSAPVPLPKPYAYD